MILYAVGFVYMNVAWQLASVVSVLEDMKGFKAMTKSRNLIKGKMWIAVVIFFKLNLAMIGIQILFARERRCDESIVRPRGQVGVRILVPVDALQGVLVRARYPDGDLLRVQIVPP
ncbi:hypothetical protein RHGRI_031752 [Rhododendron griersonianum]|uniref:Uncharacterized protein n=1 Tax=Rhododendron griersonianum TaxID=479676 RepID=A0AAV6IC57_9ERIC|nr:hypothetical protein RHGRI_031752 [Rhododendron griersonianum]